MQNQLYDRDFNLWIEQMATALSNRDVEAMDWSNLLEEIEDMGKSEKRSLESYLERLVEHILKLKYWRATPRRRQDGAYKRLGSPQATAPPQGNAREEAQKARNYKHWQVEVVNFRNRIFRLLDRSPSLKNYMEKIYPQIFSDAISAQQIERVISPHSQSSLQQG